MLHDLGSHAIDLSTQLTGEEPDSIAAETATRRWPADHVRLRLSFPSGATAACELAYGSRSRERLAVRGPVATARFVEPNAALHVEPAERPSSRLMAALADAALLGYRGIRRSQSIGRTSVRGALAAFEASLRSGAPFRPGLEDGARNARYVAVALRSAASGGVSTAV